MTESPQIRVPVFEEVTNHYVLVGPDAESVGRLKTIYRVVDRRTTTGDAYKYPSKEDEYTEKTNVIAMLSVEDPRMGKILAEMMIGEIKRRAFYDANQAYQIAYQEYVEAGRAAAEVTAGLNGEPEPEPAADIFPSIGGPPAPPDVPPVEEASE